MVKSQIQLELEALRQQKLTNTHRTKLKEGTYAIPFVVSPYTAEAFTDQAVN